MKIPTTTYYKYRSAVTGRFVSKAYAEKNPTTTVRITYRKPKKF